MGVGLCEFESHRPHKETSSPEDVFLHLEPGRTYYDESYNFPGKGIIQERRFTVIGGGQWGPAGKRIVPAQWAGAVGKSNGQALWGRPVGKQHPRISFVKKLREIHLEPESPF